MTNITSHNQTGGITAHTVNSGGTAPLPPRPPGWKRATLIIGGVLSALAAIVTILEYLGITNWR